MGMVKRGEVYWVELDPTRGSEIRKIRPCLIISPNDMNAVLPRILVVPITSKGQPLGCRPVVQFKGRQARILLDRLLHNKITNKNFSWCNYKIFEILSIFPLQASLKF
jgi:mRNA interferase MazF